MGNMDLSRFLSLEILGSLILTAFAIGGVYASLADGQEALQNKVVQMEQRERVTDKELSVMATDIAVIKQKQSEFEGDIKDMRADVRKVLDILREQEE